MARHVLSTAAGAETEEGEEGEEGGDEVVVEALVEKVCVHADEDGTSDTADESPCVDTTTRSSGSSSSAAPA